MKLSKNAGNKVDKLKINNRCGEAKEYHKKRYMAIDDRCGMVLGADGARIDIRFGISDDKKDFGLNRRLHNARKNFQVSKIRRVDCD